MSASPQLSELSFTPAPRPWNEKWQLGQARAITRAAEPVGAAPDSSAQSHTAPLYLWLASTCLPHHPAKPNAKEERVFQKVLTCLPGNLFDILPCSLPCSSPQPFQRPGCSPNIGSVSPQRPLHRILFPRESHIPEPASVTSDTALPESPVLVNPLNTAGCRSAVPAPLALLQFPFPPTALSALNGLYGTPSPLCADCALAVSPTTR